jgi:hypothetical protein
MANKPNSKEVLVNPLDIMANGFLAQASQKPTAIVPQGDGYLLDSESVALMDSIVKGLSSAEKDGEDVQVRIKAQVDNLYDFMEINQVVDIVGGKEVKRVRYGQYKQGRSLFIQRWLGLRKTEKEDSAERAFNRYFAMTGLDIPQSDDADAVRKREAKEKAKAEMVKIADLDKAISDAVAVMDFDTAKKLQAEEKRRKMQAVKDAGKALEDELNPIKQSIRDELKLCMDKATLVKVVEMLRGKK